MLFGLCISSGFGVLKSFPSMSKRREVEDKEVSNDKMKGDDFDEGPPPDKIRKCDPNHCSDHSRVLFSGGNECQDADYVKLYWSSDELGTMLFPRIPMDLEITILARVGILEFRKLCSLNKRFLGLIKSGHVLRERRVGGLREACVFMRACGEPNWLAFDQTFTSHKALPVLPSDDILFESSDKESLSAGTHLLLCGIDMNGPVIWTYDILMNKWFRGASMIKPRCLFASASCGDFAYVAGGIDLMVGGVLNSTEKYDPQSKSWKQLPNMIIQRKMSAGFYMDNKFYVIGGLNQDEAPLTCGEVYQEDQGKWERIPDMLNGLALASSELDQHNSASPPLVAVVNNELYLFEPSSNLLLLYLKSSKSWKDLGPVPIRADINKGWGVGFKSLGDQLLVIGGSNISLSGRGMNMYSCCPDPNANKLTWKQVVDRGNKSHFVQNCTVMLV